MAGTPPLIIKHYMISAIDSIRLYPGGYGERKGWLYTVTYVDSMRGITIEAHSSGYISEKILARYRFENLPIISVTTGIYRIAIERIMRN
jgi:hypothetical protein